MSESKRGERWINKRKKEGKQGIYEWERKEWGKRKQTDEWNRRKVMNELIYVELMNKRKRE